MALHMAIIHLYICTTSQIDIFHVTIHTRQDACPTTTYGSNLTTAIKTASDHTAINCDISKVWTTLVIVTSTKHTTIVLQLVDTRCSRSCLVIQFRLIDFKIVVVNTFIIIADITIVKCQMRGSEDGATLSCAVGIPLNGRYTLIKCQTITWMIIIIIIISVIFGEYLILADTNHDIGCTGNVIKDGTCDCNEFSFNFLTLMFADMSFVTTTENFS